VAADQEARVQCPGAGVDAEDQQLVAFPRPERRAPRPELATEAVASDGSREAVAVYAPVERYVQADRRQWDGND
jgi:hypothetical protein